MLQDFFSKLSLEDLQKMTAILKKKSSPDMEGEATQGATIGLRS